MNNLTTNVLLQRILGILLVFFLIAGTLPMAIAADDVVYPSEGVALEDPYSPDYGDYEEEEMYDEDKEIYEEDYEDDEDYTEEYEYDEYLNPVPGYMAIVPLNTIFVPHTGNASADEAALRDAFAQGPSYTIELESGTWHLTGAAGIELQEGQTLIGNGSTIHAFLDSGAVFRSRVDNVTLSDFTLIRAGWGYGAALCIGGREPGGAFSPYASDRSSNIVLKDITIQCDRSGGPRPGYVMSLHGVNGISMENLIFNIEHMTSGIRIASSVDVKIENFTINSRLDIESIIFSYSPHYRVMAGGDHDYSIRDFSITGLNLGITIQPWIYLYYSPPWPRTISWHCRL